LARLQTAVPPEIKTGGAELFSKRADSSAGTGPLSAISLLKNPR